jgi:hypothetical protein
VGVGQPRFKIPMEHDEKYLYRKMLKLKFDCAVCDCEHRTKAQLAIDASAPKYGNSSKKVQHYCHHSIGRKHIFLHVKFETRLPISLARKYMSKSDTFHGWSACRANLKPTGQRTDQKLSNTQACRAKRKSPELNPSLLGLIQAERGKAGVEMSVLRFSVCF